MTLIGHDSTKSLVHQIQPQSLACTSASSQPISSLVINTEVLSQPRSLVHVPSRSFKMVSALWLWILKGPSYIKWTFGPGHNSQLYRGLNYLCRRLAHGRGSQLVKKPSWSPVLLVLGGFVLGLCGNPHKVMKIFYFIVKNHFLK